ncbi:TIGR04222 domain-containing membrane protein [Streptomyces sp. SP18CS02]|uniref:TIGR04222 domain-containing membrane protein n=1 Tax=Streptomyces sp. SP18CS02 TaxID=3002531 RepID=UPI002E793E9F|nr:TIGR04222 domain-containing membrane protein [Streptomyces sp. SP18CS02]MEE1756531.1 TIGR04222 domain-containing membrane protein [Streptomyces sp. SP18CS02]
MLWVPFVLVAWAVAAVSCARLCIAALEAARPSPEPVGGSRELSLYEAAFLAGGPLRVTDLTLVSMHRRRGLLLAHTGWATVVDPRGRDELERSVIGAIGPGGQSRIAAVRAAASAADPVRALAERLVAAGLAVPDAARSGITSALRAVRRSTALTVALAAAVLLLLPAEHIPPGPGMAWFALPLVLTLGCLVIARVEVHPYTRWASPAGQHLLREIPMRGPLTAVAVEGVRALDDPALRAALTSPGNY